MRVVRGVGLKAVHRRQSVIRPVPRRLSWHPGSEQRVPQFYNVKVKDWTLVIAPLTSVRLVTSSALLSRKWQLLQRIMWPSIARDNGQLDPRCS